MMATNSTWTEVSDGPWTPREGLMAVAMASGILMTGGRVLHGARATNDVCERAHHLTPSEPGHSTVTERQR